MSTQTGLGFVHGGPGCDRSHHLPNEWMLWAFASPQPACPGSGSCHMHPSWGSFSPHPSNSSSEKLNHTRFTLPDPSVAGKCIFPHFHKNLLYFFQSQRWRTRAQDRTKQILLLYISGAGRKKINLYETPQPQQDFRKDSCLPYAKDYLCN